MSLCDQVKTKEPLECVSFSMRASAQKLRAEIELEIEEYLNNGGKIQCAEPGESAIDLAKTPALINEFTGEKDTNRIKKVMDQSKINKVDHFYAGENRTKNRSQFGQNIRMLSSGAFTVLVSNFSRTFKTEQEAITWRDKQREVCGLPPASY